QPELAQPGCTYYICLLRDGLLLNHDSTCFLCFSSTPPAPSHDLCVPHANVLPLEIFPLLSPCPTCRGERFAFGHHYLRPQQTHHAPSRRFYRNELFRVPMYEVVPLRAVVELCWVMDLYTYCKEIACTGRPKGAEEQDVYICDYRLDKSAHLFYKIHRNRYAT
uniref:BAH domain-containing protein n=1 Tax=Petromyzon marinus TaxID=7757 RepID=S4RMW4_PETMA